MEVELIFEPVLIPIRSGLGRCYTGLVEIHWRQVNFERGVSPISLATIIQ